MKRFAAAMLLVFALLIPVFGSSVYAQSQFDVYLLNKEPVYSRMQISDGYDTAVGNYPFRSIEWVSGSPGYFVVSGNCNANVASYLNNLGSFESGGMYVLKEDGSFVAARDVCFDTSTRAAACFEGGGCYAGTKVLPVGNNKFIRQLHPEGYGYARSPVLYEVSGNSINPLGKLFFHDLASNVVPGFNDVAYANGKMVGSASSYTGSGLPSQNLEIYDLNMNLLGRYNDVIYPLAGVGDYFLAFGPNRLFEPLRVYKIPSNGQISAGQKPQLVKTLSEKGFFLGYSFDPTNPNRIALFWANGNSVAFGGDAGISGTMSIYEPGANGLTVIKETQVAIPVGTMFWPWENFAVAGDYIAYGKCPPADQRKEPGRGEVTYNGCELVVEKNGAKLMVEPLPRAKHLYEGQTIGDAQIVRSIAISPTGKIAVATYGGPDNGNIYLYQIKNFQGGNNTGNNTGNTTVPPPANATTQTLSLKPGWNLISSSLIGNALFASHQTTCTYTSPLWAFDSGTQQYVQATSLAGKKGMWIRAAADCTTTVTGDSLYTLNNFFPLALGAGWNFIAGPPSAVQVSELTGCTITRGPFWYNPSTGWEQPTALEPRKGYALRVAGSCSLSHGSIPPLP